MALGLGTGGLERLLIEFVRYHDPAHELHVASLSTLGPPADEIRRLGASLHIVPDRQGRKLAQLKVATGLLRRLRPDVLHTHNAYAHLYGSVSARLTGVPIVVHTRHGVALTGGALEGPLFRLSCLLSDAVVCVSEETKSRSLAQGCRSSKCHLIWNGVDTEKFRPGEPERSCTLISVGRLEAVKDLPTMLRAFAIVHAEHPDVELMIVGEGSERTSLEALSRGLGLSRCVHFAGERSDVLEQLRVSAAFVNSSLSEGVSLAVLEAMATSLPVVATAVGGNKDVVQHGVSGLLVPPGDPAALAGALSSMAGDPTRRAAMGRAARSRAVECFDSRRMVSHYERLYGPPRSRPWWRGPIS